MKLTAAHTACRAANFMIDATGLGGVPTLPVLYAMASDDADGQGRVGVGMGVGVGRRRRAPSSIRRAARSIAAAAVSHIAG